MERRAVLGFDIGGTKTLCAVVDQDFKIVEEVKFKTAAGEGREHFIAELTATTEHLLWEAKKRRLKLRGVGVGFAGRLDTKKCTVQAAPNIKCLEKYSLRKFFEAVAGLKVVVGNDAQLGLYAEHQLGAARGFSHVLGIFFGTGVGGAAILGGELYRGASGLGGQVGDIVTHHIAKSKSGESFGTLDKMASKLAIAGTALSIASRERAKHLAKDVGSDFSKITWGALAQSIKKGDESIEELLRSRMRVAGAALATLVNFMNPELVLFGGGLTEELPQLVAKEVRNGMHEYLLPEVRKPLKFAVAELENRATLLGAAKYALDTFK